MVLVVVVVFGVELGWGQVIDTSAAERDGKFFVFFCFVLFCFVLFCFVLFCFVLFCFVLFCFVWLLLCSLFFCLALLAFFASTNGDYWEESDNWGVSFFLSFFYNLIKFNIC